MRGSWILIVLALAASTSCSRGAVKERASSNYVGQSFDTFVLRNGVPEDKFALSTGSTAYRWTAPEARAAGVLMKCEIQIVVGAGGLIESVEVMHDTIGGWNTSRCHEVLK